MIFYTTDFENNYVVFGSGVFKPQSGLAGIEDFPSRTVTNVIPLANYFFCNFANHTTLIVGEPT